MAKYIAVRPRWNPRGVVVNYVLHGKLYVRSWPSGYRDAKTAPQLRQRGKMAQLCDALPYLKELLAAGYRPCHKRNGRKIGSYHVAVGEALREWFDETPRGPRLALSRVRLTEGVSKLPPGLTVCREGAALRVAWGGPLRWRKPRLLLAAREASANEWVSLPMEVERGATGARVTLPPEWADREIETWVAFVGDYGRARTTTRYGKLPPAPAAATAPAPPRREEGVMVRPFVPRARKGPSPRVLPPRIAVPPGERHCACKFRLREAYCTFETAD